jgi:hypothetical protein
MNAITRACFIPLLLGAATTSHAGGDPERSLFDADFNSEPLDQQIGTGGPTLGEPVEITNGLSAIVRGAPRPSPALELSQTLQGSARSVRFEFLNDEEVTHGDLVIRLTLRPEAFDYYNVYVRERTNSAQSFLSMHLYPDGNIYVYDEAGYAGIVGSYTIAADHVFVLKYHMDLGTYDVEMDSLPLITGRSHGVIGNGVGALVVGVGDIAALTSLLYVDRIHVARGDGVFLDGFE